MTAEVVGDHDPQHFATALAALAVRVLLSANGFNVAKTMGVIDHWIENYGREADTGRGNVLLDGGGLAD